MKGLFQKRWQYHLLIWSVAVTILSITFLAVMPRERWTDIPPLLLNLFIPAAVSTYLLFYARDRFFDRGKYLIFIALGIVAVGLAVVLSQLLQEPLRGLHTTPVQEVSNYAFLLLVVLGIQSLKRSVVGRLEIQELREKRTEAELLALRTQLNPHFLLNTLNNIYAVNQKEPARGSDMLLELADVMRYHLEYSRRPWIDLPSEWQLLRAYIELERLRLRDNCELKVELPESSSGLKIAPLVLLIFVENAFKHGTHPVQPCFVHIRAHMEGQTLHFSVTNSVITAKKVASTQVGLENTRRRLAMVYPDRHELRIERTDDIHTISLSIEL